MQSKKNMHNFRLSRHRNGLFMLVCALRVLLKTSRTGLGMFYHFYVFIKEDMAFTVFTVYG